MRPFDLEAAKAGAPLVTRDGRPAKFIAHVGEAHPSQRLLVLIDGVVLTKFENGKYASSPAHVSDNDLFMAPKTRTVWLNLYDIHPSHGSGYFYPSQEEADEVASPKRIGDRAWPIEIEA